MHNEWLQNPITVAVVSGIGTGAVTLARRLAIPTPAVKKCPWWRRLQHAFAGFVWAGVGGGGMALAMSDIMQPTRLMGLVFLAAFCVDITSSEGIAWIARTYLRVTKDTPSTPDDGSPGT